jgi:rubrerythrin
MELSTFGAVLAFAIEMEERSARFYREAAERKGCEAICGALQELAKQSAARRDLLVRTRQEQVTEMVLEPITGLRREDYETQASVASASGLADVIAEAVALEQVAQRFYSEVAEKGRYLLAGVARSFTRLARENEARRIRLEGLARG